VFVFVVTLGVGAILTIALAPLYADRLPSGSIELGSALVALAISAALLGLMTVGPPAAREDELFLTSFVLLTIGSVFVLGAEGHDDGPSGGADGDPPWWPEFESGFRNYVRKTRPLARIR